MGGLVLLFLLLSRCRRSGFDHICVLIVSHVFGSNLFDREHSVCNLFDRLHFVCNVFDRLRYMCHFRFSGVHSLK